MGDSVVSTVDGLDVCVIVGDGIAEAFIPVTLLDVGVGVSDIIVVSTRSSAFGAYVGS